MPVFIHATCVALRIDKRWRAVLLRGPSGAGKSDLALRVIDAGGRLVADDQTCLERHGRGLIATAPPILAGLIEARGVGIVRLSRSQLLTRALVVMLVDLVPPDQVERLPEPARESLQDVKLPRLELAPFEVSSVAKLRLALAQIPAA